MTARAPIATSVAAAEPATALPLGAPTLGRGDLKSPYKNYSFALLSILLPPVAVFIKTGDGAETGINTLLWCLGLLPGMCHSLLITQTDIRYSPICSPTGELALNQAPIVRVDQALANSTGAAGPAAATSAAAAAAPAPTAV